MKQHKRLTALRLLGALAIGLALLAVPHYLGAYATELGYRLLILCTLCEAWALLAGYAGLTSFGSAAFVGLGAYVLVGFLNNIGDSIPVALLASACVAALFAAATAPAMFRMRGLYFTVGTLALGEGLRLFMINSTYFGGATGWFFRNDPPTLAHLYLYALAIFGIAEVAQSAAIGSRVSLPLRAIRDDEGAAMQFGVPVFAVKFVAFVATSALIGVAGGVQALKQGAIEPYGMFSVNWSLNVALASIIGGLGYRLGAIVGAVTVTAIGEALLNYPQLNMALTGALLILIVRLAPNGICGLVEILLHRFRFARLSESSKLPGNPTLAREGDRADA